MQKGFRGILFAVILTLFSDKLCFALNETDFDTMNPNVVPALKRLKDVQIGRNATELIIEKSKKDKETSSQIAAPSDPLEGSVQEMDIGPPKVVIKKIEFSDSNIFSRTELLQMSSSLIGRPVDADDIKTVISEISRNYVLHDYLTARAYLPQQDLSKGVLKIGLFEGKIGEFVISGNKYTKTSYIQKRIRINKGKPLQLKQLEKDLIKFNSTNDVKLSAVLVPGKEIGTTDIVIKVDDPFPFRINAAVDNAGRDTIGLYRGGVGITHDNVFGVRDKLTAGSYLGKGTQIAYADYNIPINTKGTRVGASFSYNHINVIKGPYRIFDISGNAFVYSGYLTHPLVTKPDLSINTYSSANFKYSTTFFDNSPVYDSNVFSLTQGISGRKDTKRGIWYTGHYASVGMKALKGDTNFFKYEGNATRLHDFGKGVVGQFRVSGQWSNQDQLPWIEQYQLGGISSVRGYSEGLLLGKSGYFASAELVMPIFLLPKKVGTNKRHINLRDSVRGAVFVDHGAAFPYKGPGGRVESSDFLTSVGVGLRVNFSDNLNARFYWGFPLSNNPFENDQRSGRFHFEVTTSPDLTRLKSHPKAKKQRQTL